MINGIPTALVIKSRVPRTKINVLLFEDFTRNAYTTSTCAFPSTPINVMILTKTTPPICTLAASSFSFSKKSCAFMVAVRLTSTRFSIHRVDKSSDLKTNAPTLSLNQTYKGKKRFLNPIPSELIQMKAQVAVFNNLQ